MVFRLRIRCDDVPDVAADEVIPEKKYINSTVLSRSLEWMPQASQAETFADNPIRPVHDDILLAKLRPRQELDLELHCHKGTGRDHAKFSPVGASGSARPRGATPPGRMPPSADASAVHRHHEGMRHAPGSHGVVPAAAAGGAEERGHRRPR